MLQFVGAFLLDAILQALLSSVSDWLVRKAALIIFLLAALIVSFY